MSNIACGATAEIHEDLYQFEETYWWSVGRRELVLRLLKKFLPDFCKNKFVILDVGCGGGQLCLDLAKSGFHKVIGADIACAATARSRPSASLLQASAVLIPFKKETIDAVLALDLIEHLAEDAEKDFFEQAKFVLKPKGLLILTTPALPVLKSRRDLMLGHFRRYTKKTLSKTFYQNSFQVELISYCNSFFLPALFLKALKDRLIIGVEEVSDVKSMPNFWNKFFTFLLHFENNLILSDSFFKRIFLPLGTSLVVVGRKC